MRRRVPHTSNKSVARDIYNIKYLMSVITTPHGIWYHEYRAGSVSKEAVMVV